MPFYRQGEGVTQNFGFADVVPEPLYVLSHSYFLSLLATLVLVWTVSKLIQLTSGPGSAITRWERVIGLLLLVVGLVGCTFFGASFREPLASYLHKIAPIDFWFHPFFTASPWHTMGLVFDVSYLLVIVYSCQRLWRRREALGKIVRNLRLLVARAVKKI